MEIAPRIVATFFIIVLLVLGACEIKEKEDAKALQEWRDGKAAQIPTLLPRKPMPRPWAQCLRARFK